MRPARRIALAVAAAGLALGAAGCTYFNPVQTHEFYQAADGTNANLEQNGTVALGARNMIVVVEDGGEATLYGSLANYTKEDVSVELEGLVEDSAAFAGRVSVPAGQTIQLGSGPSQHAVQIGKLDVKPGAVMKLRVSALDEESTVSLPVTDTTLEYYQQGASDGAKG